MSEQIKKQEDNDDLLTPAGFEGNPSLWGERQLAHNYEQMTNEVLSDKAQLFIGMLNNPNTLPHHKKQYAQLIDYIAFEFACRDAERKHALGGLAIQSVDNEEIA